MLSSAMTEKPSDKILSEEEQDSDRQLQSMPVGLANTTRKNAKDPNRYRD